ncbi:glycerophosphodiester phosphodiesterase family protein [Qipengyuania mesophila]|uniref:glycerophosphodiester phosphodiesterase family protein n=1 Tax=Qipengyuania mesophila TaxID=2867246 RepID=UPI003517694C
MRSLLSRLDRLFAARPDPARVGWLRQWTYAHRGLHGNGRVENSRGAFRAALEAGLGIECDIQRSRDDRPMVFHDWDFTRLIGRPEKAAALTAAEWATLSYLEGEEAPIALADLLAMVAGQVPLLIEIKSRRGYDVERSCKCVAQALHGYEGRHAVMSFDPRVARWFRRHSPQTVCGLVMREDEHGYTQQPWQRHLALWIARPEFLAYHVAALPNPMVAGLREAGLPVLTWTVNSSETRAVAADYADAPIAEGAGLP